MCISHLINLISTDFEEKQLNTIAKTALCQTLSKLHVSWILIRRSSLAKTTCKNILRLILKSPNKTRWNSWYGAVRMCNQTEIKQNLNKLIRKLKLDLTCVAAKNLQTLASNDFA